MCFTLFDIPFSKHVKNIHDNCGFSNVWDTQFYINESWLKQSVKLRLQDQYKQVWNSNLQDSSKSVNYRIFKETFEFEKYFDILDTNDCITLCKFRTTNNKLPVEIGIWSGLDRVEEYVTSATQITLATSFITY